MDLTFCFLEGNYPLFFSHHCSGAGAEKLAEAVIRATEQPVEFKFLYDLQVKPN